MTHFKYFSIKKSQYLPVTTIIRSAPGEIEIALTIVPVVLLYFFISEEAESRI
jgi:hypothetical protein